MAMPVDQAEGPAMADGSIHMKKKSKIVATIVFTIALVAILVFVGALLKNDTTDSLKIHFFNAGKADAIILSKDDHHIMIDTGEATLSTNILQYFHNQNIKTLDYLIITHFDKDHVGSAADIINDIEIGAVLQSNVPKESDSYNSYLSALQDKGITPTTVSGDYTFTLANLDITVNGPEIIYDSNQSNNSSLIVSVTYDQNRFLFMGDAQNARLKDFLSMNQDKYDLLKVPHHGAYQKRLDNLLASTEPQYAIITDSNSEPASEETIDVLQQHDIKYYSTSNGEITILSNGKHIKVRQ